MQPSLATPIPAWISSKGFTCSLDDVRDMRCLPQLQQNLHAPELSYRAAGLQSCAAFCLHVGDEWRSMCNRRTPSLLLARLHRHEPA